MPLRAEGVACPLCGQTTHGALTARSVRHLAFAVLSASTAPRAAATSRVDLPRLLLIAVEPEPAPAGTRPAALRAAAPSRLLVAGEDYFLVAAILAVSAERKRYTCLVRGGGGLDDADFDDEALRIGKSGGSRTTRKLKRVVLAHYRRGDVDCLAERVQKQRDAAASAGAAAAAGGGSGGKRARTN